MRCTARISSTRRWPPVGTSAGVSPARGSG
jgi:hypothetical protein